MHYKTLSQRPVATTTLPHLPIGDDHVVNEKCIPAGATVFFDNWKHTSSLPTPSSIAKTLGDQILLKKGKQSVLSFPSLQLVIKHGVDNVLISEGQVLWLLSFVPHLRVPKVYGWCTVEKEVFLYLECISGVTLEDRWETLSDSQKISVAQQLDLMISSMRRLKLPAGEDYVGSILRGHITDQVWNGRIDPLGPFETCKNFNNALLNLAERLPGYPDNPFFQSLRDALPDDTPVVFTHGDIHPSNIIVSPTDAEVMAIIDWHDSGWFPEHWEYLKASFNIEDWRNDWQTYIGKFIRPAHETALYALDQLMTMGCC